MLQSHILLARAIGGEFISRKFRAIVVTLVLLAAAAIGLSVWLVTMSAWWWLLLVPVIITVMLGVIVLVLVWTLITVLRPELSAPRQRAVEEFVDKLERVAEHLQMPMFMIVFQVARDIIRPRNPTFITKVASDSSTLHSDLTQLQKMFND